MNAVTYSITAALAVGAAAAVSLVKLASIVSGLLTSIPVL